MSPEAEAFAALLVEHVRDRAIRACDARLSEASMSKASPRWRALHEQGVDIPSFIPDVVDSTIARLLACVDEGLLELEWEDAKGAHVDLTVAAEDEMCGNYLGSDAWRSAYSKERYFDHYAGLPNIFDVPGVSDDAAASDPTHKGEDE
jgi:hypothetical protein